MSKRVRISNSVLNGYGFRVLTEGMDIGQYCRNPVLLDMHERGNVIGYMKDVKVDGDEITGEPVFDEASELSRRRKKQWEFGSIRMVSAGIDILEVSDSAEHLVQGQTRPTITRSKLTEVSIVDIGANDDAIVLTRNGVRIELGRDGECPLPLLDNKPKNQNFMDQKILALSLGLPETADEATINSRLAELKASKEEADRLRSENSALQLARVTSAVEKAVSEKRIGEDKKQQFIDLGKKIGAEELENTFAAMSPQVRLSSVIGHQGGVPTGTQPVSYNKLSDVPVDKLEEMREKQPAEYRKLYKAEYGMECEI